MTVDLVHVHQNSDLIRSGRLMKTYPVDIGRIDFIKCTKIYY